MNKSKIKKNLEALFVRLAAAAKPQENKKFVLDNLVETLSSIIGKWNSDERTFGWNASTSDLGLGGMLTHVSANFSLISTNFDSKLNLRNQITDKWLLQTWIAGMPVGGVGGNRQNVLVNERWVGSINFVELVFPLDHQAITVLQLLVSRPIGKS